MQGSGVCDVASASTSEVYRRVQVLKADNETDLNGT